MTTTDDTTQALQDEITNLKAELLDRYQELATMQKQIMPDDGDFLGSATQEAAKRKKAEAQLESMKKSTSWRVTAPMRHVVNKIRR